MNHITKKPKSLGKKKSWEQRAKSKVTITQPQVQGCTFKPLLVAPCSKVTSGFKSNLSKLDIPDVKPFTPKHQHIKPVEVTSANIQEYESLVDGFDEERYQQLISKFDKFNS